MHGRYVQRQVKMGLKVRPEAIALYCEQNPAEVTPGEAYRTHGHTLLPIGATFCCPGSGPPTAEARTKDWIFVRVRSDEMRVSAETLWRANSL